MAIPNPESGNSAKYYNRTRRSRSLPRTLVRRGQLHAVPVYYLLRLSDLAREGFEHSGSHRFADHIYRNEPSGRGGLGRWIDARLLAMPAVRAFRSRFFAARDELAAFLAERQSQPGGIDVLSVPCGIPRELVEGARLHAARGGCLDAARFHGLDLDPEVLADARSFALQNGLEDLITHRGDALDRRSYPERASFITCTGFAEFLDDDQLVGLFRIFHDVLEPGGRLVTSGMARRRLAAWLLSVAEIQVRYRGPDALVALARRGGFTRIDARRDETGIQTMLVARR
jgi:SAM-dependent methyltransferase